MKIVVDAMGGDNAPAEIVKGAVAAVTKLGVEIVLVGDEPSIKKHLNGFDKNIEIVHTTQVIGFDDDPTYSIRRMSDSSIVVGMKIVASGDADAFVSAGSTGALVSGATLIIKRIKGIRRVALGTMLPSSPTPSLLMDCGANADCTPEFLKQFAIMGNAYAKGTMGIKNPRIGLINNGTEETKGNELTKNSYSELKSMPINFVGNIEAKEILTAKADVLITDGFTGNAVLKTIEGTAKFSGMLLKEMLTKNIVSKVCAVLLGKGLKEFKKNFSADERGGAPILGTVKPVIKAHGSSNAYAFYNAIYQAKIFAENNVIDIIKNNL